MTDSTRTAAAWIERRLLLDLLLPADTTPTDAIAVVGRALSDASVEIAERDETIAKQRGQLVGSRAMLEAIRTMAGIGQSDPTVDTIEVVRRRLECDREIAAELRAERDRLAKSIADLNRSLTAAIADRDNARHERDMAIANRDGFVGAGGAIRADRDAAISQGQLAAAEAATLRDRVRELEARPVLTVERLAAAISSKRTGEEGPRIGTPATIYAQLTEGGAVTLPAQDAAAKLALAYHMDPAGRVQRPDGCRSGEWDACVASMSRALASLGAPAKTPSVPADVFAGVSVEDLAGIYAASFGATTAQSPARIKAIVAVLDAIRVRMVSPVDPEKVARVALDPVEAATRVGEWRTSVENVRAYLAANGIPVTPEAGKAGSP